MYVVDCPQRLPALVPSVTLFSPCITLILGYLPDLKLTILTINVLILTVLLPYPQKKGKNKHCCVELHPGGIRRHWLEWWKYFVVLKGLLFFWPFFKLYFAFSTCKYSKHCIFILFFLKRTIGDTLLEVQWSDVLQCGRPLLAACRSAQVFPVSQLTILRMRFVPGKRNAKSYAKFQSLGPLFWMLLNRKQNLWLGAVSVKCFINTYQKTDQNTNQ